MQLLQVLVQIYNLIVIEMYLRALKGLMLHFDLIFEQICRYQSSNDRVIVRLTIILNGLNLSLFKLMLMNHTLNSFRFFL